MIKIKAEIYSRVSGYYRPVNQWNKGKQSEYEDRTPCKTPEGLNEKDTNSSFMFDGTVWSGERRTPLRV